MNPCSRHQEDLALLAGGDLGDAAREAALRGHVDACAPCAALLDELSADREAFARIADCTQPAGPGVAASVLARLAAEAHAERAVTPRARRSPDLALVAFGRAAAAAVVVVSAAVLGLGALSPAGDRPETVASAAGPVTPLPVHVRRAAGEGVELTWNGDGRDASEAPAASPYRVLASATAADFSGAQPIEVAGRSLVARMPLPASRGTDRQVTFFRVE